MNPTEQGRRAAQRCDAAIDLGTSAVRVWVRGRGLLVHEPALVATYEAGGDAGAFGTEAIARAAASDGDIILSRPLARGSVIDDVAAVRMLERALAAAGMPRYRRPRVLLVVPSGATDVEERARRALLGDARATVEAVLPAPLAAAVGADLPVTEPGGMLVVDVGAGRIDAAVLSLGQVVAEAGARIGCEDLHAAVVRHVRRTSGVMLGMHAAAAIVDQLGVGERSTASARSSGRRLRDGQRVDVTVSATQLRSLSSGLLDAVAAAVSGAVAQSPAELAHDIHARGMYLAGGGALVHRLRVCLSARTRLKIVVPDDPLTAAVRGAGMLLEGRMSPVGQFPVHAHLLQP